MTESQPNTELQQWNRLYDKIAVLPSTLNTPTPDPGTVMEDPTQDEEEQNSKIDNDVHMSLRELELNAS